MAPHSEYDDDPGPRREAVRGVSPVPGDYMQFKDGAHRVRAKIYVASVTEKDQYRNPQTDEVTHGEVIEFRFVNGNDPDSENAKFWSASPEASPWQMTIRNPGAQGVFKLGDEFYLDFVEAVRVEN